MESTLSAPYRAVRTCDAVLKALERYPDRDDAIERLELEIIDARLEASLAAHDAPTVGAELHAVH
jgi:hypothetical protein